MARTAALVLCLFVLAPTAHAQDVPARKPKPRPASAAKQKQEAEAARERRANAMFLLTGLADEAAKFADLRLRARVRARVADVVWASDRESATALFRRAWESAQLA